MSNERQVHLAFESLGELRKALIPDLHPAGLFVPAWSSLVVGEPVRVQIDVQERASVVLSGIVIWRRVSGIAGGRPGVGISFGPHEDRWMALVESTASPSDGRFVPVAFVVQNDKTLRKGTLTDLRARGARLSAPTPPAEDMVVALRLRPPRSSPIVAARVVRRDGSDAWLEILSDRAPVLRFWEGLVANPTD